MDLIIEPLNMFWHSQFLLEVLHRIRILILRCKHAQRNFDALSIIRIHHSRVHLSSSREASARLGSQGNNLSQQSAHHPPTHTPQKKAIYLPTPTHPQTRPLLNSTTFLFNLLHQLRHLLRSLLRICRAPKERSNPLLLLLRIRRVILVAQGLAEEEIRHEDLVLVGGIGVGEDIGALESLVAETEDVIDDKDGGGGVGGAGGV